MSNSGSSVQKKFLSLREVYGSCEVKEGLPTAVIVLHRRQSLSVVGTTLEVPTFPFCERGRVCWS